MPRLLPNSFSALSVPVFRSVEGPEEPPNENQMKGAGVAEEAVTVPLQKPRY